MLFIKNKIRRPRRNIFKTKISQRCRNAVIYNLAVKRVWRGCSGNGMSGKILCLIVAINAVFAFLRLRLKTCRLNFSKWLIAFLVFWKSSTLYHVLCSIPYFFISRNIGSGFLLIASRLIVWSRIRGFRGFRFLLMAVPGRWRVRKNPVYQTLVRIALWKLRSGCS